MKRALLLLFLLSAVSFAQPFGINDIEKTFYKDILQIYQYPGAPFSGNPFTDIIMIFFIPTGFLVILVYTIAGRFYENPKLRLLLSVMFFLFAVAGGAFGYFVSLASAYLWLLFFIGGILFIFGHFGKRGGGHAAQPAGLPGSALGGTTSLDATLEDAQIIRRYDQLLNALKTEKDALAGIKQEAKENPGVDLSRLLGEKEVTVRMINQDLMKYEQIVHDMKMGSGLKGRMAELKRRIGV